jgi:hypothetical protein
MEEDIKCYGKYWIIFGFSLTQEDVMAQFRDLSRDLLLQ